MEVAELRSRVMASRLTMIAVESSGRMSRDDLDRAMAQTVEYLRDLERCWSRFLVSSDITRINSLSDTGGVLTVDPSTLTLLATMLEGYQVTSGRFDPTVLRALVAEGYAASRIDPAAVTQVTPHSGIPASLHDVALDPLTNTVSVPPGLVLDPGGVGKGLAADLAVIALLESGVDGALVEVGGDLSMAGTPPVAEGWIVAVEHPDPSVGRLCSIAVDGGGVATSSVRSRRWTRDDRERHHLIDPRTSTCSTTDLTAVTVVAPSGWLAEVHATAALSVGSEHVVSYLEGHGLSGLAVAMGPAGDRAFLTRDLVDLEMTTRSRVG